MLGLVVHQEYCWGVRSSDTRGTMLAVQVAIKLFGEKVMGQNCYYTSSCKWDGT